MDDQIRARFSSLRIDQGNNIIAFSDLLGIDSHLLESYENSESDFPPTILCKAARLLGVDITDFITGENPKLTIMSCTSYEQGIPINGTHCLLNYMLQRRSADQFLVKLPDGKRIDQFHSGQVLLNILEGNVCVYIDGFRRTLRPGESSAFHSIRNYSIQALDGSTQFYETIIYNAL